MANSIATLDPNALKAFQEAIALYKPGGAFGAGIEARLGRNRKQALASGTSALVGSGLAGTTMAAGLGKKFEEEVAVPALAQAEETKAQNLSALYAALATAQQGGYESSASRGLQKELARLQSTTQLQTTAMGIPSRVSPPKASIFGRERPSVDKELARYHPERFGISTSGGYSGGMPTAAPSLFR